MFLHFFNSFSFVNLFIIFIIIIAGNIIISLSKLGSDLQCTKLSFLRRIWMDN